jgi:hypothetical protein
VRRRSRRLQRQTAAASPDPDLSKLSEVEGEVKDVSVEMHEGINMAAAPSPDGSTIAISLQGALWTMPAAGGVAKKITPWDVEAT